MDHLLNSLISRLVFMQILRCMRVNIRVKVPIPLQENGLAILNPVPIGKPFVTVTDKTV